MTDLLNRTAKFSDAEFWSLPRADNGDIRDLYDAFIWITDEQVEALSGDDFARFDDFQEELRCLTAQARAEFA
jgi:hypothetical protein